MSDSQNRPDPEHGGLDDTNRDLAEHERPEVGLVPDEDLPEDLRPTDDNPLAQDPGDEEEPGGGRPGAST